MKGMATSPMARWAAAAILLAGCSGAPKDKDPAAEAPPAAQVEHVGDVTTVVVDHPEQFPLVAAGQHQAASELVATGTVTPDISRTVPVVSIAAGRVVDIRARLGDTVKKGQLLLRVQSSDVSGAFSDYQKAVADQALAAKQYDRAKGLYDHGAISLNDFQIAEGADNKAKVDVETTAQKLRVLGSSVDHPSGIVDIVAPISGVITDQQVTNAAGIQGLASANPFTISDLSDVWIVCDVYENDLPSVRLGDMADIRLNAYPDQVVKGKISNIGAVLDPDAPHGESSHSGAQPRRHASGHVRHRDVSSAKKGNPCGGPGVRGSASARSRLGVRFRRRQQISPGGSHRGPQSAGQNAGNRIGREARRAGRQQRPGPAKHRGAIVDRCNSRTPTATQLMRRLVDFALNNRFMVVALAILLLVWGAISFHNLPVEAYPDVANNYVQVITQWPGRAAEEVEQQVTIPIEIADERLAAPRAPSLRFALRPSSSVMLIFDDSSDNDWNRAKVLERLSQVTLPTGLQPQMGTDWSPVGQIYWYTLKSTNPQVRLDGTEIHRRLAARKAIQVRPQRRGRFELRRHHPRISGPRRSQRARRPTASASARSNSSSPTTTPTPAAASSNRACSRSMFAWSASSPASRTSKTPRITTKNGTVLRVKDIATVTQGPQHSPRTNRHAPSTAPTEKSSTMTTWSKASSCCAKAPTPTKRWPRFTRKSNELNNHILPPGVKIVPFLDRSDLLHVTTHTVLQNLTEGVLLVSVILFFFLGNSRGALIVALTIPFSLLFASICLDLNKIPANLLSLGALDFGMVVDGTVVIIENIVRHFSMASSAQKTPLEIIRDAVLEVLRPVFYARAIIIAAYLPIFTLQSVEGRLFKPMAWTVSFALLGALIFAVLIAPVLALIVFSHGVREWPNPVMAFLSRKYRIAVRWAIEHRKITVGAGAAAFALAVFLMASGVIGSEFLPHLDEGAIWVRGTLAPSTGPTEGVRVANEARVDPRFLSGSNPGDEPGRAAPMTAPIPPDFSTPNISWT